MAANFEPEILRHVRKLPRTRIMGGGSSNIVSLALVCLLWAELVQSHDDSRMRKLLEVLPSSRSLFPSITTTASAGDTAHSEWKFDAVHGRALLATTHTSNYRPLVPRDDRLDPFDSFNHYRKGYDVKSKHYWGSGAFTGISGYAIAVAWLVLGLLLLFLLCCCKACLGRKRTRSKQPGSGAYYWAACVVVFLLSAVAFGCTVVLFVACNKFTAQAYTIKDVLVEAAQNATTDLYSVRDTLAHVKDIVLPYNPELYASLTSTETKLNSLALVVNDKVFVNKKMYQKIFKIIEIVFLVVTSLNLLLVVLGFASTFLGWRRLFYLIIVLTWIFIALNWVMYGFFFSVHYLANDTCLAFKEYLQQPQNTTLDDLLPCADLASSSTQYFQVRKSMKTVLTSATVQFLFYAKGATSLIGVCDPIGPAPDYKYTGVCANDTLPIGELSELVKPFVCNGTRSACLRIYPFYVNQSTYNEIYAITSASQSTLDALPLMEGLTNCSLVTNPINTMVHQRCGPAKVAIDRIWIAFAVLSSVMMLLLPFWCLARRRHVEPSHNNTSITPQDSQPSTPASSAPTFK